ncbi:SHOCT domain-containing protein [Archangium primigenium]|nr:SHOCT domain-containing protein [Archangium primigenium]MBM7116098.1 SHOCT domain-containing protein [Archangium primigenium]
MIQTGLFLLLGLGIAASFVRSHLRTRHVRQQGTPAVATLLKMERTVMQINKRYVYDFLLEVKPPGRPAYQVRLKSRALDWKAVLVEPGLRLKVMLDPEDPQRVVVLEPVTPQKPLNFRNLMEGQERPSDPVKALKDLQSMADNGLITPDEYARKKAEILARL